MSGLAGKMLSILDEAQLALAVKDCAQAGVPVLVTGGAVPPTPQPGDESRCALSLAGMDRLLAHEVADLTVTVQAGLPIGRLEAVLRRQGQRVAIEAPDPDWTVGGIIAGRSAGFRRGSLGPPRDQILGMRTVLADGAITRCGGRVVKNVTGFDLMKLHAGARGAFGIISEVTLRTRPLPSDCRSFVMGFEGAAEAFNLGLRLRDLPHTITGLAVLGGSAVAAGLSPWLLVVRIEGSTAALDDARRRLREHRDGVEELDEDDADLLWRSAAAYAESQGLHVELGLRPSLLSEAVLWYLGQPSTSAAGVVADLQTGILRLTESARPEDLDARLDALGLAAFARDRRANVALRSDPRDLAERVRRFGAPEAARVALLSRLKKNFDPLGLLGRGDEFPGVGR